MEISAIYGFEMCAGIALEVAKCAAENESEDLKH